MKKTKNLWALKRICSMVLAIVLIVASIPLYAFISSAAPVTAEWTLLNGDFEETTTEADAGRPAGVTGPLHWSIVQTNSPGTEMNPNGEQKNKFQAVTVTETLTGGGTNSYVEYGLTAEGNDGTTTKRAQFVSNNIKVPEGAVGKDITFSLKYKLALEDEQKALKADSSYPYMHFYKADGTYITCMYGSATGATAVSTSWIPITMTKQIPADAAYFTVSMYLAPGAHDFNFVLKLDDFEVKIDGQPLTEPSDIYDTLLNGDFEQTTTAGDAGRPEGIEGPKDWYVVETNSIGDQMMPDGANKNKFQAVIAIENLTGGGTNKYVKFGLTEAGNDTTAKRAQFVSSKIKVPAEAIGRDVTMSVKFKVGPENEAITYNPDYGYGFMHFYKEDGTLVKFEYGSVFGASTPKTEWTPYTMTKKVPEGAAYFTVSFYTAPVGVMNYVYSFDDFKVEVDLPEETPPYEDGKVLNGNFDLITTEADAGRPAGTNGPKYWYIVATNGNGDQMMPDGADKNKFQAVTVTENLTGGGTNNYVKYGLTADGNSDTTYKRAQFVSDKIKVPAGGIGRDVTFSFKYKLALEKEGEALVADSAYGYIHFYKEDGTLIQCKYSSPTGAVSVSPSWIPITKTVTIPEGTAYFTVSVYLAPGGKIFNFALLLDDFNVEVDLPEATPPIEPGKTLINGDFELTTNAADAGRPAGINGPLNWYIVQTNSPGTEMNPNGEQKNKFQAITATETLTGGGTNTYVKFGLTAAGNDGATYKRSQLVSTKVLIDSADIGRELKLTFRYKLLTQNEEDPYVYDSAYGFIHFYKADGTLIECHYGEGMGNETPITEWTPYELVKKIPKNAAYYTVSVYTAPGNVKFNYEYSLDDFVTVIQGEAPPPVILPTVTLLNGNFEETTTEADAGRPVGVEGPKYWSIVQTNAPGTEMNPNGEQKNKFQAITATETLTGGGTNKYVKYGLTTAGNDDTTKRAQFVSSKIDIPKGAAGYNLNMTLKWKVEAQNPNAAYRADHAYAYFHFYNADGTLKRSYYSDKAFSAGSPVTEWADFEMSKLIPSGATYFTVSFYIAPGPNMNFVYSFDDVVLTVEEGEGSDTGVSGSVNDKFVNGDFEKLTGDKIDNWTFDSVSGTSYTSTPDGYDGTKGLLISRDGEYSYGTIRSEKFKVTPGQTFKTTFMFRYDNLAGNVYGVIYANFYDKNGNSLTTERWNEADIRPASVDWSRAYSWHTVPEDAASCNISVRFNGNSYNLWLDDFLITFYDPDYDATGFDKLDDNGEIYGWTYTNPKDMKIDNGVFRDGTASLFISQDVAMSDSLLVYDSLIPVIPGLRYEFNVYVKSYDSDISADGMRMNLRKYKPDGEWFGAGANTDGRNTVLNADSTPSGWKKLVLGYYVADTVGFVRPEIYIPEGIVNLWIDDLTVTVYDLSNEFVEEFDSVSNSGIPDGWTQTAVSGNPEFLTGNSITSITAKKADDIGTISARWNTQMEKRAIKYSMSYLTTGDTKAKVTIKFFGFNNQEIVADRIERELGSTGGEYTVGEIDFVLFTAKYMTIEVSNTGKGELMVDFIHVVSLEEEKDEDDISWRGYWVWHDEDYQDSINGTPRYFRYHFTLAEDPVASFLQITADDRLKVYVNGVQYEDEAMDQRFTEVSVLDTIHESLHKGDNVIAVAVNNFTAYAGLIFDGFAEDANGNRTDIISSVHILSSKVEYKGWQEEKYDDSKWGNAKFMDYNANGIWPDDLTFDKSPYIKDKFEVVDYEITDTMIAGETGKLTMTIIPENDFTKNIDLIGNIWIRNSLDKILGVEMIQVSGPNMNEWKAGEEVTVSYKFTIPDFIASGRYNLQLDTNQVVISNVEIMNNKFIDTIRLTNDTSKKTDVKMVQSNGTFAISIDGRLYPYQIHNKKRDSYADDSFTSQCMHDAGICITQISTPIAYNNSAAILEGVWTGDGEYNWTILDERIYKELAIHPDTYLMPQLWLAAPKWWMEKHQDQCVVDSDGNTYDLSMFSESAIVVAHQGNVDMLNHMMEQPYWNRIIGFNLVGYGTAEFMWEVTNPGVMFDYSKPANEYFRKWLTKKYGTDAALQKAWNNPNITLKTAENPTAYEHLNDNYTAIHDPEISRAALDYTECQEYREIEIVGNFHDLVAKTVNDTRIQGSYFGYLYTRAFYHNSIRMINTRIDELLDNPNIDFFAAPATYTERLDGEAAAMCQMVDGMMKKGKAVMLENDYRACGYVNLSKNFFNRPDVGTSYNMSDSMSGIAKLQAISLTQGTALWYYDIEGMMFEREEFSRLFEVMQNEQYIELHREKSYTGDVAYIMDAHGYEQYSWDGGVYSASYEMLFEQKYDLARAGIMTDYYSLADLVAGNVPDYKVYVMVNTVEIDAEEKAAINKYLKNNGKVVLWQWLAGASDGKKINAENMSDVIGMDVEFTKEKLVLRSYFNDEEHWLTAGLEGKSMGSGRGKREATPVAYVTDTKATVKHLASLYDGEEYTSLAVMESKNWTSVFSSVPGYPVKMVRNVLKKAGVHIYSENSSDVVYASSNYVGINTAYGGEKTLKLKGTYAVYDVINQKTYSHATDVIKFTMTDNETSLFRLMPVNTNIIYVNNNYTGTISTNAYNEVKTGENFTCDIAAEEGYVISEIITDTVREKVNKETYTVSFENVDTSHYVRVIFAPAADAELDDEPVVEPEPEEGGSLLLYILLGVGAALVLALLAGGIIFLIIFLKNKKEDEDKAA